MMGYSQIAIMAINIAVNGSFIVSKAFSQLRLVYRKYYNKIRRCCGGSQKVDPVGQLLQEFEVPKEGEDNIFEINNEVPNILAV